MGFDIDNLKEISIEVTSKNGEYSWQPGYSQIEADGPYFNILYNEDGREFVKVQFSIEGVFSSYCKMEFHVEFLPYLIEILQTFVQAKQSTRPHNMSIKVD